MKLFGHIVNFVNKTADKYNLKPNDKSLIWKTIELAYEHKSKRYLKKYAYALSNPKTFSQTNPQKDKIWQLWLQGIDQAPPIVKKCLESVKKYSNARDVIILNDKNLEDYISLPGYIHDKKNKGIITNAHFSDIIRLFLLTEHGGTWIDATVMLTNFIPDFILNAPLFCFSATPKTLGGFSNILASSWFVHSTQNNKLLNLTKNLLLEYWKHEKALIHYFLFHLSFAFVISSSLENIEEWKKVPFFSNVPPHILQFELFNSFYIDRLEQIKQMSPIHKLTYHKGPEFKPEMQNTFYDVLVNNKITT